MRQRIVVQGNKCRIFFKSRNNYSKWASSIPEGHPEPPIANPDAMGKWDKEPGLSEALTESITNGSEGAFTEVEQKLFQWHVREGWSIRRCARELKLHPEEARRLLKKACMRIYIDAIGYMS